MIYNSESILKILVFGYITMVGLIWNSQAFLADAYPNNYYKRNFSIPSKSEVRRGINIDLQVATESPSSKLKLQEVLEDMMQAAREGLGDTDSATQCPSCSNSLNDKPLRKVIQELKPGYACDQWDPKTRACNLDRNIGDSVTFVLDLPHNLPEHSINIVWKQEFQVLNTDTNKNFTIDPVAPPWNIVIGSRGSELRLSPITESDIDFNFFSATLDNDEDNDTHNKRKVIFKIRVMPIDQGILYPGAFLILNMLSFVSLPQMSMTFKWYIEDDDNEMKSLPSNMRVSLSGGLLTISELRKEQQGIISCAVYTNLNVFATKKRFLIKEVNQENNRLMFLPTRPMKQHRNRNIFNILKRNKRQFQSSFNEDETQKYDDKPTLVNDVPKTDEYIDSNKKPISKSEFLENRKYEDNAASDNAFSNRDDYIDSNKKPIKSEFIEPKKYDDTASRNHPFPNRDDYSDSNKTPIKSDFKDSRKYDDNSLRLNFIPNRNQYTDSNKNPAHSQESMEEVSDDAIESNQLPIDDEPDKTKQLSTSDKIAKLISKCDNDGQCSLYAQCIQTNKSEAVFCRCLPRFEGNGIFCWEVHKANNFILT